MCIKSRARKRQPFLGKYTTLSRFVTVVTVVTVVLGLFIYPNLTLYLYIYINIKIIFDF